MSIQRKCKLCGRMFTPKAKNQVHCDRCKSPHSLSGRWIRMKRGAEKRGHPFELLQRDLRAHWQKPCIYCGAEIRSVQLDRVDNKKGYVPDNVVPCCLDCNLLKGSMDKDRFLATVLRIAQHQRSS